MRSFIEKYVEGCNTCQQKKLQKHPCAVLEPFNVPEGPWEAIGVDLITQLLNSNGFDGILVCTDLYSKQIHAILCKTNISASEVMDLYYKEIFRLHGLPLWVVSDRGPQFAAKFSRMLLKRLGIASNLTSGYHLQTNGQTKRLRSTCNSILITVRTTGQNTSQWLSSQVTPRCTRQ